MMNEKQQTASERVRKKSYCEYQSKSTAIKLIRQLTQAERSRKGDILQSKIKTLSEINKNLEQAIAKNQPGLQIFGQEKLIIYIRHCFLQNMSKVQPIRYLRLIMLNETIIKCFLTQNIPLYISKSLERQNESRSQQNQTKNNSDQQNFEVLKFMNQWIKRFPLFFPKYLAGALVSYGQLPTTQQQKRKETKIPFSLKMLAIDIIMNLAIYNPKLCACSGGFTVLQSSVLDPTFYEKSNQMICKLIYFFNEKETREIISPYLSLTKVFHIFTDLDSTFHQDFIKSKGGFDALNRYQQQLSLAKSVIISICKSWTGLIYVGNQKFILSSFLEALKQIPKKQNSQVRNVIFSILEEILNIGNIFLIQSSKKAVIGKSQKNIKNEFKISSLLNSYLTTLLQLLIDNNLFRILIELSGVQENSLSQPAQKLLKKLTILVFNFFPDSSKYIDFLISAATVSSQKDPLILKSSSSFVVNKIGNYVYQQSKRKQSFSILNLLQRTFGNTIFKQFYRESTDSILQSLNFITHRQFHTSSLAGLSGSTNYRKYLLDLDMITRDNKEKSKQWKWDLIEEFLVFPSQDKLTEKPDSNEKYKEGKVFKYLLRYYSPSRDRFIQQKWSVQNFQHIRVGQLLVQNAITIAQFVSLLLNPDFSQFQITINFVAQLQKLLQKVLSSVARNTKQFYSPFYKQCERQLILWIPLFSYTKIAYERLLCQNNFFQIIYSYLNVPSCAHIINTILHYMDFCRDNMAKKRITKQKQDVNRSFSSNSGYSLNASFTKGDGQDKTIIGPKMLLQKSIKQGSKGLKLSCIQILRILFRIQLNNFSFQGMRHIVFLIRNSDGQVLSDALQLLNYLLSEKKNVNQFVKALQVEPSNSISSILSKIENFSKQIIIKMLSTTIGLKFIQNECANWLEKQYQNWMKSQQARSYCIQLESMLDQCLNFTKKSKVGLKIPNRKQYLDLLYLYRLPWIVYLNDNQYPLNLKLSKESSNQFILYADFTLTQDSIIKIGQRRVEVSVGIGCVFIDQNFNQVKNKYAYIVSLSSLFNNQKDKAQEAKQQSTGKEIHISRNQGISVFFTRHLAQENNPNKIYYNIQRIQIQINAQSTEEDKALPLHLIKELSHTPQGIQFLCDRGFLNQANKTLQKYENSYKYDKNSQPISLLDIRSVLWALGFFGSTTEGIQQIIEKKILQRIVRMSFESETLSLRGTCRYVLNMFCYSEKGRNILQNNSYQVNKKTLSCYPKSLQEFFSIKNRPTIINQIKQINVNFNTNTNANTYTYTHTNSNANFMKKMQINKKIQQNKLIQFSPRYPNEDKYWQSYKLQPMNLIESKIFNQLSKLINNYLSTKNAILEIRDLQRNNHRIWYSVNLFRNVISLITFYKLKYDSRKKVLAFFDDLIKSPEFNNEVQGKINYGLIKQLTQ